MLGRADDRREDFVEDDEEDAPVQGRCTLERRDAADVEAVAGFLATGVIADML